MANLGFKLLKLFAADALNNGQFGSAQLGTKVLSDDPDVLQALPAWENGWLAAVISGQRLPTLEEMQAVQFVLSYGVTGQQQWGIWPWSAEQTYGTGSITNVGGVLYKSLQDDNTNNAPDSSPLWWEEIGGSELTVWGGTAGGTANALTLTPDPALTSYAAGNFYYFLSSAANTSGTVTIDVSALGTKNVKKIGATGKTDLAVGDIQSGVIVGIVYDGTDFVIVNSRPYSESSSIATASTVNLNNATGDYVVLTGTTTVTAITLAQGVERTCRASGTFTLTNGASLILPTGSNITTAAGDVFTVRGEASGVVRVTGYMRASGAPLDINQIAIFRDERPSGTNGGSVSSGSWYTRTLQTSVINGITDASGPSSNQITLPAGTYDLDGTFSFGSIGGALRVRLYNVTDSAVVLHGTNNAAPGSGAGGGLGTINGRFTLTATKTLRFEARTGGSQANTGNGIPLSSGENEVYANIFIKKVR